MVEHYAFAEVLTLSQGNSARTHFSAAALNLAQLEDALVKLRRAVSWSSRFSGFNWWLQRRQKELAIDQFLVVPGPGSCREFWIERESSLASSFRDLSDVFTLSDDQLDRLDNIRILTVPRTDGASARWHPISLGHELGHLKFTLSWAHNWLSKATSSSEFAKSAVALAKETNEPGSGPAYPAWFGQLLSWLTETACDSVMQHFYGEEGLEALRTYLNVHSDVADGNDHPGPVLRLRALAADGPKDLRSLHEKAAVNPVTRQRRNAYCQLAVQCRDAVRDELEGVPSVMAASDVVLGLAKSAMADGSTPKAADWNADEVEERPSSVETGLVRSLWQHPSPVTEAELADDQRERTQRSRRIEHAVDFLQFVHRFRVRQREVSVDQPKNSAPLSNVLFLSPKGVTFSQSDEEGLASADVRLGRHFIVFRRNQIASLNSLDVKNESRQTQDEVEVGWGDYFILHPGEMVLAATLESLEVSEECSAQVLSRSSLGRMGLLSATAVQVQSGFRGCLTLELVNLASVPLRLSPGQRIAQVVPTVVTGSPDSYDGKYQDQDFRPRFSAVTSDWETRILYDLTGLE
jgi:deoxycytidine triphosphate deaminase